MYSGFDFPNLADPYFTTEAVLRTKPTKFEKHGLQTDSGVDQNGQQIKYW